MRQQRERRALRPFHRRRMGTRRRIFFMYCAVIAALLLALVPICRQTVAISYEKTYDSYQMLMNTGLSQAEAEISSVLNTLYAVKNNESFQRIAQSDDEGVRTSYYLSWDVLNQLQTLSLQKNVVRDFELLFAKNDLRFTSRRVFSSLGEYYGGFFSLEDGSAAGYEEMQREAFSSARVRLYPAQRARLFDEGEMELILYYTPFFLTGGQFSHACGAFLYLDAEKLRLSADPQALGGAHVLADAEGNLLYACGCTQEEALRLIEAEAGRKTTALQDASMDLYVYRGRELGLTWYWCISPKKYPGNRYLTLGVLFLYASLAAALGLLLAALMTRRLYAPIQRLKDVVGEEKDAPESSDEYAAFANAYLAVQKNNSAYRERIQELDSLLESNLIDKLLWQVGDVEKAAEWLEKRRLGTLSSGFRLVQVCVRPLYPAEKNENAEESGEMSIISALLSDLLPKYWEAETFVHPISGDQLVFLIPDTDGERQVISDKLNNLCQHICRGFEAELAFSVSPQYRQAQEIHAAFEQTQDVLQLLSEAVEPIAEAQGAVFFTEEMRRQRSGALFNQHTMERLCNLIGAGSAEAARQMMDELIGSCPHDHESRMQLFYNLRSTLQAKYSELEGGGKAGEALDIPSFSGGMASDEAFERLTACCEELCALYEQAFPNGAFSAKERILEYIADNYADPELYGKQIASKFDLSEKYLYTWFKKQMGVGFSDYLEELRLHRATELLSSSRMGISEIAAKVGFNSHNTFYKAFKRKYGITPSEYRNAHAASAAAD